MSDSLWPHGVYSPWNSPSQNTGVGSLSLLQGVFPTQGWNPGLPHCRRIYQLSHKGSPRILEWVAYPFSSGSSGLRNQTVVSCIAGGFFTNWDIREAFPHWPPFNWLRAASAEPPLSLRSPPFCVIPPPSPQGLCHPASPWNSPEVERLQALSGQMVGILTLLGPSLSILAFNAGSPVFKTNIQKMTELPLVLITVHLPQPNSYPSEWEGHGQSSRFQGLMDS